jgi:hypothetical protein
MLLGAQFLIFLFAIGSGLYLLWLAQSPEIRADEDAVAAIHGLRLAATFCIAPSFLWLASFIGLLKKQPWGWWLGLAINFFVLSMTTYELFEESNIASDDLLAPLIFLIVTILQLLVRPTTWRLIQPAPESKADVQSARTGI